MKKILAAALASVMLVGGAALAAADGELNICSPNSDGLLSIIPVFEEQTTNWNPMLSNIVYDDQVVDGTCTFVRELLEAYPEIQIYMENMFDSDPVILQKISEQLCVYSNFGVSSSSRATTFSPTRPPCKT